MGIYLMNPFDGKFFTDTDAWIDWSVQAGRMLFSECKFYADGENGVYIIGIATSIHGLEANSKITLPAPIQLHLHAVKYSVGFKDKKKDVEPHRCETLFIKLFTDAGMVDDGKCYSGQIDFDENELLLNMFEEKPELAFQLTETTEDKLKGKEPDKRSGGGRKSYSENSKQKIDNKVQFIITDVNAIDTKVERKTLLEAAIYLLGLDETTREIYLRLVEAVTQ